MIVPVVERSGKLFRLFRDSYIGRDCVVAVPLKPIAVVAHSIDTALDWLRKQYGDEIRKVNMAHRRVDLYNGMTYVIVINREQARGMEFSSLVIAPDYESLVDTVKSRIR